ncbi:major facilitator superfamily domain-containing protein 6 [Halyomorpha halys]|uniref:major facilitator superfamily domain-containing protein 6 n=1 Tax=Halyomorpha halys TaxID=286706 RepID=UPI0006D4E95F|nr:major facilitator superfamily domain-containing protein 6 [Halyomorpha halys]
MAESEKDATKTNPPTRFEVYCKKLGINSNLVMLKVTLFIMYGANASLIPFLTIHMQSIGLTVEEIAIVYLALPLTTFLSPPITGFLVDKLGHYKSVVVISLVLNGLFHHALVLIPQMEIPGEVPIAYVLRHPETGKVEVWWSPCPSRECPEEEELNLVLDDCLDYCPLKNVTLKKKNLLTGVHQSIAVRPPTFLNSGNAAGCAINPGKDGNTKNQVPTWGVLEDLRFHFEKQKHNHTSLGKKKGSKNKNKPNGTSIIKSTENPNRSPALINNTTPSPEEKTALFVIDMHADLGDPKEHLGMEIEEDENEIVTDFHQHFDRELIIAAGINYTELLESDLRCGGFVMATNLTYNTLKELAADCMLQVCSFREGGPEVCPPDYKESEEHVFWTYFVLRFLGTTMNSASVTVMDPIALTMVQHYGGEFGRERLFSIIGMAIFSPITGFLIDYSSRKLGYTDYSYAFYSYSFLLGLSAFSVMLMPIYVKIPADNILKDMFKLLKMPHVIMFILFLYVLGNFWGFLESYLFLYLKELGADNYLLGVTVTIGTLSSIPFLYGAEKITKKIGHVNVIVIAFFSHALRLMGYSFIDNAWWCFPFEAMESLSVHLMWVAAATYCAVLAPKALLATLIGILGMAHFSLGRGSGSFFGGFLIGTVGARRAFKTMGLIAFVGGIIYGLMHFFWLHKYTETIEKEVTEPEAEKLNTEDPEKNERDVLSESTERLSLMIRFNHRGSLTSLNDRGAGSRRSSSNEIGKSLLKSALESNYKNSNSHLNFRTSSPQLSKPCKVTEPLTPQQTRRMPSQLAAVQTDDSIARRSSIKEEDETLGSENDISPKITKIKVSPPPKTVS